MPVRKAQELLDNNLTTKKDLQECIDSLRRESQYIRYAIKMHYRTQQAAEEALTEIENLSLKLKERL